MTFFQKFIALLKAMFVHIHLSLRVTISRKDDCNDEKAKNTQEEVSSSNEQSSVFRD